MKLLTKITIVALALTFSIPCWAKDDGISVQGMLATSKIAGACGILDSLIHFQKTTKMVGGDEFVTRFWSVEAARQGLTVQQLSERCNKAISAYGTFWNLAGEADE